MRNIYVVRHTQSVHHVEGLAGGWYDTPLTEKGIADARRVADSLHQELRLDGIPIYSSDLKRCSQMASIFSAVFNSPVILDPNLREMHGGACEGKPEDWVRDHMVVLTDGNRLDHRAFENAESRRDVGRRMMLFLGMLMETPFQDTIVITHGFAQSFLIMAWMKIPVENMDYGDFSRTAPGSLSLLHEDDVWKNRHVVYVGKRLT